MKSIRLFVIGLFLTLSAFSVSAQETNTRTVEQIDEYIEAVKVKIEHVKNDPEQHERALKMGWYEQMNGYIQNALKERERILAREEKE